jgi:chemotaxis protein MotA
MKIRIRAEHLLHEMMLEGVVCILEGLNPRMVETMLQGFLAHARTEHQPAEPSP